MISLNTTSNKEPRLKVHCSSLSLWLKIWRNNSLTHSQTDQTLPRFLSEENTHRKLLFNREFLSFAKRNIRISKSCFECWVTSKNVAFSQFNWKGEKRAIDNFKQILCLNTIVCLSRGNPSTEMLDTGEMRIRFLCRGCHLCDLITILNEFKSWQGTVPAEVINYIYIQGFRNMLCECSTEPPP